MSRPAFVKAPLFQSLSGFPMSCNPIDHEPDRHRFPLFQSLSGFPMSCNAPGEQRSAPKYLVSIPIGFSNELQLSATILSWYLAIMFQSLSGFPMSCNAAFGGHEQVGESFQSLSGFPMSCNRVRPISSPDIDMFQSLSGFPMSCNLRGSSRGRSGRGSFNPYRVFQ